MALKASLLGRVGFEHDGNDVVPVSRKGTALLSYLCLRPEGARREDLAELLWGPGRLANLRQELYALRRLSGAAHWLEDGEVVTVTVRTDVQLLEAQVAGDGAVSTETESAALVPGELLPGLERVASPAFLDWLELERRRVSDLRARAARVWAERLQSEGRHQEALRLIDGALRVDPLDERLVRTAMRSAYASGDAGGAIDRFESFREAVRHELGLEPGAETVDLAGRISRGEPLSSESDYGRLEPELRGLAQVIAVAGGALDVEALASVVERRPLDVASDLARLERGGWLDQHLTLPPDAARTVLESTPAVVRRLLHQRVAKALRGMASSRPAEVARHLLAADAAAEAAPHFLEAAEKAIAGSALEEAVPQLMRTLWCSWEAPELRLRASLLLEGCAGQLGEQELQDAALCEAEDLAWQLQSDSGLAEVRMRRSRTLLRRGKTGEALESALEALEIARRIEDVQLTARARNAVGGAQFYLGDLEGAESSFRQNLEAADPVERYRARNNLGGIAGVRGRTGEALSHLEEALTLGRAAGEHTGVIGTLNNLAATAERVGDYRRSLKHFKESLALVRQSGTAAHEGQVLVNLSVVYSRLGELGPAWNTALEVEELAEEQGEPRLMLLAHEQKAEVATICGEHQTALELLSSAAGLADEVGDERKKAAVEASLEVVRSALQPERLASAADRLEELAGSRLADVSPWMWLELGLNTSEPAVAERCADRAESFGSESDHLSAVICMVRLRTGLLPSANKTQLLSAAESCSSLMEKLESAAFQQVPHCRLLIHRWRLTNGDAGSSDSGDGTLQAVVDQLAEQGAGLPRSLVKSLLRRPEFWLDGLRTAPVSTS